MADQLKAVLKEYYCFRDIRPPSMIQKEKITQLISAYEHEKSTWWNIAAVALFLGMVWTFNLQREKDTVNGITNKVITVEQRAPAGSFSSWQKPLP